jgi:uncharacterized surface protein with fasciclin (FAS1) repeats
MIKVNQKLKLTISLAITILILLTITILSAHSCDNFNQKNKSDNSSPNIINEISKTKGQAFIKDDGSKPTVLHIAINSANHSTLVKLVQAADLENSLVNAGPLMVFAPINRAFDVLPKGTLENLLKPENKQQLSNILKYHVTPGNYSKKFLKKFKKLGQANNQYVDVKVIDGEVYVGGARIIASVPAGNGIVHVVDNVLLPNQK